MRIDDIKWLIVIGLCACGETTTASGGGACPHGQAVTLQTNEQTHFGKTGDEIAAPVYGAHSFTTRQGGSDIDVTWNITPVGDAVVSDEASGSCPSTVSIPVNVAIQTSDNSITGSFVGEARLGTKLPDVSDAPKLEVVGEVPDDSFTAFPQGTYEEKVRVDLKFEAEEPVGGSISTVEDRDLSGPGVQPTLRGRMVLAFGQQ